MGCLGLGGDEAPSPQEGVQNRHWQRLDRGRTDRRENKNPLQNPFEGVYRLLGWLKRSDPWFILLKILEVPFRTWRRLNFERFCDRRHVSA